MRNQFTEYCNYFAVRLSIWKSWGGKRKRLGAIAFVWSMPERS
jgi:hypothetical protein